MRERTRTPLIRLVLGVAVAAILCATIGRAAQDAPKTTRDKVYTDEQAARGEKPYADMCASCHDPDKAPPGKRKSPPLVGDAFLAKWDGRRLSELMTETELNMPTDGSVVLTDAQTEDLTAYTLKVNGFPSGSAPLTMAAAKTITIVK